MRYAGGAKEVIFGDGKNAGRSRWAEKELAIEPAEGAELLMTNKLGVISLGEKFRFNSSAEQP